jgi:hypothetical protein
MKKPTEIKDFPGYRLDGASMTFWLWMHSNGKGEGYTDEAANRAVLLAARAFL